MEDQKIENLLNLALSATPEEREKSYILNVGYSEETKTWDLIVKYTGSLQKYVSDILSLIHIYSKRA